MRAAVNAAWKECRQQVLKTLQYIPNHQIVLKAQYYNEPAYTFLRSHLHLQSLVEYLLVYFLSTNLRSLILQYPRYDKTHQHHPTPEVLLEIVYTNHVLNESFLNARKVLSRSSYSLYTPVGRQGCEL